MKITGDNFLSELKRKNPQAIEYLIGEYGALLKSVLIKNLYDQSGQWEECFNDVLLAVWNHPERFEDKKSDFKNWICAIAKYKAIDVLRKEMKNQQQCVSLEEDSKAGWIQKSYCQKSGLEYDRDSAEELDRLLQCLSEEDKELFLRRYVEEQPIAQMEAETGISRALIYSRI